MNDDRALWPANWATLERPADVIELTVEFFTDQPVQGADYLIAFAAAPA
ncbi:hypothetical protein [Streptomyces sp. WZ-12]|nr:hypothetical protein [Streptomyces sp. WZ-12]